MSTAVSRSRKKTVRSAARRKTAKRMSNARLLKLAKTNRPPQSWFDQTDCPFIPTKG